MKSFIACALAVITVIFGSCQAQLPTIGTCTFIKYTLYTRPCNTAFVQAMIKNPKSDCSAELNDAWDCAAKATVNCNPGANEAMIKRVIQTFITKEMMCELAGVQYPRSIGQNVPLPCKLNKQQYTSQINACYNNSMTMWRANRADPAICGEYMESKACVKDILKSKCNFTNVQWFRDQADLALGIYNPFCANKVDPTTLTPSPTTDAKLTAAAGEKPAPTASAQSTPLKEIVVVFVAIVTLLFV